MDTRGVGRGGQNLEGRGVLGLILANETVQVVEILLVNTLGTGAIILHVSGLCWKQIRLVIKSRS